MDGFRDCRIAPGSGQGKHREYAPSERVEEVPPRSCSRDALRQSERAIGHRSRRWHAERTPLTGSKHAAGAYQHGEPAHPIISV
ncbi:hypothetical protein Y032_0519g2832 [Ancylostoma ceylanicum]|uniref:Uncharacterized protein n=1 Tax=Ancylostoma ceylanicum TaxID=53326 RepID=A0A016WU21_9BILA|nr:hypothetical protein Y032_0519g2832 [Ancylostoma ceylanicum]